MNLGRKASVMRIRQGAPGVTCSPLMSPSWSQRTYPADTTHLLAAIACNLERRGNGWFATTSRPAAEISLPLRIPSRTDQADGLLSANMR